MKKLFFLLAFLLSLTASAQIMVASVSNEVKWLINSVPVVTPSYGEIFIFVVPDCVGNNICTIEEVVAFNEQYQIPNGLPPVSYDIIEHCPPED